MADDTTEVTTSATETTEATTSATETTEATTTAETVADDVSLLSGAKEGEDGEDQASDNADTGEGDAAKDGEEGDKPADDEDGADGLPEKYELTPPEGYDAIDPAMLEAATPVFKELGLGNEQAQKLVPLVPLIASQFAEAQNAEFQAAATAWAKEAKADPHMGGPHWKDTETFVAKALDLAAVKLPTISREVDGKPVEVSGKEQVEEFRSLLDATKLGNHPTILRVFRFFGQGISEDSDFIRADGGAQVKRPREAIMYPNDVKQ